MADLSTTVNGLKLPNPFIIGSGPPGTNANVICRAFQEGWGAVICKTVSLDSSKVINVYPRYAKVRTRETNEIYGWENIELISDRPFETWIDEFHQIKDAHPEGVLIASIMEEYHRDAWIEIVERCQAAGVDGFELNFSCPHGLPERKMGSAMGENPDILQEVAGWVMGASQLPVWAKMTPNVTHIEDPTRAALRAAARGLVRSIPSAASPPSISKRSALNRRSRDIRPLAVIRAKPSGPSPCGCAWRSPESFKTNFPAVRLVGLAALKPGATRPSLFFWEPTPCKSVPV